MWFLDSKRLDDLSGENFACITWTTTTGQKWRRAARGQGTLRLHYIYICGAYLYLTTMQDSGSGRRSPRSAVIHRIPPSPHPILGVGLQVVLVARRAVSNPRSRVEQRTFLFSHSLGFGISDVDERRWVRQQASRLHSRSSSPHGSRSGLRTRFDTPHHQTPHQSQSHHNGEDTSDELKSRFGIRWFGSNPTFSRIHDWFESYFYDSLNDSISIR